MVYVAAVILFLQGRSKEIQYITVNEQYLFKVNFSDVKISLTKRNFYMSLRSTPVCSLLKMVYVANILLLQGHSKQIRYITVSGRYLFKVIFGNVKISVM